MRHRTVDNRNVSAWGYGLQVWPQQLDGLLEFDQLECARPGGLLKQHNLGAPSLKVLFRFGPEPILGKRCAIEIEGLRGRALTP